MHMRTNFEECCSLFRDTLGRPLDLEIEVEVEVEVGVDMMLMAMWMETLSY